MYVLLYTHIQESEYVCIIVYMHTIPRRRAHGLNAPNYHYNTDPAICQEKNRKKNFLIFFLKPLDKFQSMCYNLITR